MTPFRITLALVLVVVAVLLTAGCVAQSEKDNQSGISTAVHPNSAVGTPSQSSGDLGSFTSPDEVSLFLELHTTPKNSSKTSRRNYGDSGYAYVSECNGTRIWHYRLNVPVSKPDEYIVTASSVNEDVGSSSLFNVLEGTRTENITALNRTEPILSKDKKYYITIDPVGDRYVGEQFTISGSTNLPMDDAAILVQVYSSSFYPSQKNVAGDDTGASVSVQEYSTTNVQVPNVEEADFVKTDGKYIYTISDNQVKIIRAYPPQDMKQPEIMKNQGVPVTLFVSGDRLVVFSTVVKTADTGRSDSCTFNDSTEFIKKTRIHLYSVRDPKHPVSLREFEIDGEYLDSRMVGTTLYFLTTRSLSTTGSVSFPRILDSSHQVIIPALNFFKRNDSSFAYDVIGIVNITADEPVTAKTFLLGSGGTVYVSLDNLYLGISSPEKNGFSDQTEIFIFSLKEKAISFLGEGSVPGTLLSQYSMDENHGNLRVATTVTDTRENNASLGMSNNLFIFDNKMNVLGKLEHLAPGERIYSARFMGDRVYLVTYKTVDPFFVIDLSDPAQPKVLGELKLPGVSEFLYPIDPNHIIGISVDSFSTGRGGTRANGLTLNLFNVSDATNPSLIDSKWLGDESSDSEVLRDPKAFLFDKRNDLIVIPLYQVTTFQAKSIYNMTYTDSMGWHGAMVFHVDPARGFTEKGFIKHGNRFEQYRLVKRALYINDTIYTMSSFPYSMSTDVIVASDLYNVSQQLNKVSL